MHIEPEEYSHIESVYNNSDVDKDTFCHLWIVMNPQRVATAKVQKKALEERQKIDDRLWNIIAKYGDKDYRWKETHTTIYILKKREIEAIESAKMSILESGNPKSMAQMLYEIRKYFKNCK